MVGLTREFFLERGYLETDTPALAPSLIPESCLEVFEADYVHPYRKGFPLYLVPSPEVWMKRVIAETGMSVFQLCKSFRNAESVGRIHNPEFTMLEYYTVGANSADQISLTEELFSRLAQPGTKAWAKPPFARMTMAEAFHELADMNLELLDGRESMIEAARSRGLQLPDSTSWEDAFNIAFLSLVEPALPADRPLVLDEYPERIECLARKIPGKPARERWELYVKGIEIANCYTEDADPSSVRKYFDSQAARKTGALVPHAVDASYADIFERFPPCSGVAVGFDRLLMVLLDLGSIDEVMLFPFSRFGSKATG